MDMKLYLCKTHDRKFAIVASKQEDGVKEIASTQINPVVAVIYIGIAEPFIEENSILITGRLKT